MVIVNDMPATLVVAPISSNQITTISTSHLPTILTIASNSMVHSGDGKSSFTKRHISTNISTAYVTPTSSLPSDQNLISNDVDIAGSITKRSTFNDDNNERVYTPTKYSSQSAPGISCE